MAAVTAARQLSLHLLTRGGVGLRSFALPAHRFAPSVARPGIHSLMRSHSVSGGCSSLLITSRSTSLATGCTHVHNTHSNTCPPTCTPARRTVHSTSSSSPSSIPSPTHHYSQPRSSATTPSSAVNAAADAILSSAQTQSSSPQPQQSPTGSSAPTSTLFDKFTAAVASATDSVDAPADRAASSASVSASVSSSMSASASSLPDFSSLSGLPQTSVSEPARLHMNFSQDRVLIYEGPVIRLLQRLKRVSITSACLSVIAAPVIAYFGSPELAMTAKLGIAGAVVLMGTGTTFVLNWFTKPYVWRMWFLPRSEPKALEFHTLGLTGRPVLSRANLLDLSCDTLRPFVSFLDTATGRPYFVHDDLITRHESLRPILKHVVLFPSPTAKAGASASQADSSESDEDVLQGIIDAKRPIPGVATHSNATRTHPASPSSSSSSSTRS